MKGRMLTIAMLGALLAAGAAPAQAQTTAAPSLATPGRPGSNRTPVGPIETDTYRSTLVKLDAGARDGLLYEPRTLNANARVAVLYSDRNFGFDPPAAELAKRGYRVLYVSYPPLAPGEIGLPLDGFHEASQGIRFLRNLPGVERVVIMGWGAGASSMTLYADVAAHGPAACQAKAVIYPCDTARASGLARPDGLIMLDPGLGAGTKVANVDPGFVGGTRSRADLDRFAAANGYDPAAGNATYPAAFRKRYFAAQAKRNRAITDAAVARLRQVERSTPGTDEPLVVPGGVNLPAIASLHYSDPTILSHTKRAHVLLGADGTRTQAVLRSTRPATGPVGDAAIAQAVARISQPARPGYTLREFLANDAIRAGDGFALTADDVIGVDWASSNLGTPAQAEGVDVPTLIMSNLCFQFVVPAEIILDHLAARDKTLAGVEGAEHEFGACQPHYGDTRSRLFGFVAEWLGKPRRF